MTTQPGPRNLELKVRLAPQDLDDVGDRLRQYTCAPIEQLRQVDTYLRVPRGRLKLRELRAADDPEVVARAQLIAYARDDQAGSRWSRYEVTSIGAAEVPGLLRGLLLTHDELARVDKVRLVGLVGKTRVHLDQVEGLGAFCELETVMSGQGDAAAEAEHQQVIAALGLHRFPVVAGSYSDLVTG